jgi:hypothetical protein
MKAEARDLTFLSTEGIVRIPFFQREYVWDEENWDELLANLGTEGRSHFLGSLILKQQQTQSGAPKEVLVIDGQQRLTTLSVLLKALYDSLDEEARSNALDALRAVLFFKKSVFDKQFQVKIQHSHIDRADFERVIRAGVDGPTLDATGVGGRVVACYRYFATQLASADWPAARRSALFAYLLDQQNKMLVVIDLAATDDEQAIFDTINSAGVRLSGADIIKNALYQRAIVAMGQDDAVALYDETWKQVFLADRDALDFSRQHGDPAPRDRGHRWHLRPRQERDDRTRRPLQGPHPSPGDSGRRPRVRWRGRGVRDRLPRALRIVRRGAPLPLG